MTDTGGGSPGGDGGGLGAGASVAPAGPDLGSSAPAAEHSPMPMDLPIWPGDPAPGHQGHEPAPTSAEPQNYEPVPVSEPQGQEPTPGPHNPAPMPSAPPTVTQSPQRAWRNEIATEDQAPQPMDLPMWQEPAPAPTQTPEPIQNPAPEPTQSQQWNAPQIEQGTHEEYKQAAHEEIDQVLQRTAYASHDVEIKRASQQQPTETQALVESQELGPEWAGWNTWEQKPETTHGQNSTAHNAPENSQQNLPTDNAQENQQDNTHQEQVPLKPPEPGSPEWHQDVQATLERTAGHSNHQRYMADLQTAQMTDQLRRGMYHPPPIAEPTPTAVAYTTHGPVPVHTETQSTGQTSHSAAHTDMPQAWDEATARQREPQSSTTTAEPTQTETRRWWQFRNQPQTPTQTHEPFQPYLRPVPRDAKPQTFTPPQAQPTSRPKPIKEPSEFKQLAHNINTLFGGRWAPVSENDKTSKRERRTIIKDRHGNRITTMDMPVTGQELAYTRARADEKWKTQNAAKVSTPGKVEHKVNWLGSATAKRTTAKIIKPLFPRAAWELNHSAGPRPHGIVNQQEQAAQGSTAHTPQRNFQAEVNQAMSQQHQEQMDSVAAGETYYDLTNYNKWQKTEQRKVIAEAKAQTQEQMQGPTPDDPLGDLMNRPMPSQSQGQRSTPSMPSQAQGQGSAPPQPAKQQPSVSPKMLKHPPGTVGFIDPRTYDPRLTTHKIGKNRKDCIVKECPHCSVEANKLKGGSGKVGLKERPSTEKDDELGYWIYSPKDRHHSYGGHVPGNLINPQSGMNIAQSNQQVRL